MRSRNPDTCAVILDRGRNQIIEVRSTVLVNQISRDAERIAKSFDNLHSQDMGAISEQFALCYATLTSGMINASQDHDDLRIACGELLSNALNSMAASAYLVRGGFVLQPGAVVRSCVETLAVVLHLMQFQSEVRNYRSDKFNSTRAIASAKRVFPPFGRLYGLLSEQFTHIGQLHKQLTPIREYEASYEPLAMNMRFIATGVWMCYVTCELVYVGLIAEPRYWTRVVEVSQDQVAYHYSPSAAEVAWMDNFLGLADAP
jgi:hypothetical protein